jgi:hypothetical protein
MSSFVRIIFDSYEVIYMMIFNEEVVQWKVGHKSRPKSFLALESFCLWFDKSKTFAFLYIILQRYYKSQLFEQRVPYIVGVIIFSNEDVRSR